MTSKIDRAQFLRAAGAVAVVAATGQSMAEGAYKSSWPEATLKQLRHPSLKDRVVLITGGSRGFGWFIAEELLQGGAKVALTARGEAALKTVADDIEKRHGKGRCVTVTGSYAGTVTGITHEKGKWIYGLFTAVDLTSGDIDLYNL